MATVDEVVQQILDIIRPMVPEGGPQVTGDLDLATDLGLDSIKVMEILENIEETFDISIPINILPEIRTVKDLATQVHNLL